MLTASNFEAVYRMLKSTTFCAATVKNLVSSIHRSQMKYGRDEEKEQNRNYLKIKERYKTMRIVY